MQTLRLTLKITCLLGISTILLVAESRWRRVHSRRSTNFFRIELICPIAPWVLELLKQLSK